MNEGAAERIRLARRARGMTQDALAAAIGVSRSAVAQWETGRAGQLAANLSAICKVLDVEPADLLPDRSAQDASNAAEAGSAGRGDHPATGDEVALLRLYRVCSPRDQQLLLMTARRLSHKSE